MDGFDEAGIFLVGEATSDSDLEFVKSGILVEVGEEGQSFGEDNVAGFFQMEAASVFDVFVAVGFLHSGADQFVHDGREVGQLYRWITD